MSSRSEISFDRRTGAVLLAWGSAETVLGVIQTARRVTSSREASGTILLSGIGSGAAALGAAAIAGANLREKRISRRQVLIPTSSQPSENT